MNLRDQQQPGLQFLEVRHDGDCPALQTGEFGQCVCTPDLAFHRDPERYVAAENLTRAARRRAAREAEKAIRKARKQR